MDRKKNSNNGIVTISIEIELGWGTHDRKEYEHLSRGHRKENKILRKLLHLCDKIKLPITFDIVGHLLLYECEADHKRYNSRWWREDPATSKKEDPLFYAPEMIKRIKKSSINHEIATHTFSHIDTDKFDNSIIKKDLKKAVNLHKKKGYEAPQSIVVPRHKEIDYGILKECGIEVIRESEKKYKEGRLKRYMSLLTSLSEPDHKECRIRSEDGITVTTCDPRPTLSSRMLPTGSREAPMQWKAIPTRVRENIHRHYLSRAWSIAKKNNSHVHLWTHLYNIANNPQWRAIKPGLEELGELEKKSNISVKRMKDLKNISNAKVA